MSRIISKLLLRIPKIQDKYRLEFEYLRDSLKLNYNVDYVNSKYGSYDGIILYCSIRHYKPKRIIEIGAGYSSFIASVAIDRNKFDNKEYWSFRCC